MNFFKIMSEYIKKIFGKKRELLVEPVDQEKDIIKTNEIDILSKQYQVTNMQNDYEAGNINENMLSEQEREDLISLYNSQIEMLQKNIDNKKRELEEYKEKIIIAKQKLTASANN